MGKQDDARTTHDRNLRYASLVTEGRTIERQCIIAALKAARMHNAVTIIEALPPIEQPTITCRCVCRECKEGDHCGEGKQEGLGDCFYPLKDRG